MTYVLYVCQLRAKVEELQEELDECREDLKRDEEIFGAKVSVGMVYSYTLFIPLNVCIYLSE